MKQWPHSSRAQSVHFLLRVSTLAVRVNFASTPCMLQPSVELFFGGNFKKHLEDGAVVFKKALLKCQKYNSANNKACYWLLFVSSM